MDASKKRHYELLQALDEKAKEGGYQTIEETTRLESLLQTHDDNVRDFKRQITGLAVADLAAHQALLEHITFWNTAEHAGHG